MTADAWLDLSGPLLGELVRHSVNSDKGSFQCWEVGAIFLPKEEAKPKDCLAGFIPLPIVRTTSSPVPWRP